MNFPRCRRGPSVPPMFDFNRLETYLFRNMRKDRRRRDMNLQIGRLVPYYIGAMCVWCQKGLDALTVSFHSAEVFSDYFWIQLCEAVRFRLYLRLLRRNQTLNEPIS